MGHTKKPRKTDEPRLKYKDELRARKKASKKNKHRARLVVRNLPFAVTEENLRQHFEQYGKIDEVKLLKREDGQLLGCGFVQFPLVQLAAKARHYLNGKQFLDRVIECDWALPKSKYEKTKKKEVEEVEIKKEPEDDGYEVKTEPENVDESMLSNLDVKIEKAEDDVSFVENEEEKGADEKKEEGVSEEEEEEDDESEVEFKDDGGHGENEEFKDEIKRPRVVSNDAAEGKTIFIKNVPFTATNEDIRNFFEVFGPLFYALVCMDSLTEHSKGTAFVKFRNKEDADQCLSTPGLTLMENILECQPAMTRDELKKKTSEKHEKTRQRDSRNLYLVKEGVILAGSKSAEGVSAPDMAKRLQVEQYKTQMLKNLNMFVARTRLIVHNIPETWDDAKFRALFVKHTPKGAVVKEARIMRNMRLCDGRGVGKSKEYGFATFTTHDAALAALRAVNNNPNIFTPSKRPIVAFSIENRAKLQAKEKRLQNSKVKNPNSKSYNPQASSKQKKMVHNQDQKPSKHKRTQQRGAKRPLESEEELGGFTGTTAQPGNRKMRSKFNLRTQAALHHQNLKQEKKKKKFQKKTLQQKQKEFTKQPKQKINKKKGDAGDSFTKLVNNYKKKLLNAASTVTTEKKKWYE